jgi:hypothetical protein
MVALVCLSLLTAFRQGPGTPEKLLGISFDYDKQEVTIRVVTTGCTVKTDFQFKATGSSLQVNRLKKDACKMVPQAVSFTYTLAEAGLKADQLYVLKNKLIANPNLANIP